MRTNFSVYFFSRIFILRKVSLSMGCNGFVTTSNLLHSKLGLDNFSNTKQAHIN